MTDKTKAFEMTAALDAAARKLGLSVSEVMRIMATVSDELEKVRRGTAPSVGIMSPSPSRRIS